VEEQCREEGVRRGVLLSAPQQLSVECSEEHALVHQASAREALHRATVRHHASLGQVTERWPTTNWLRRPTLTPNSGTL
jgi:hypothetical protein